MQKIQMKLNESNAPLCKDVKNVENLM